MTWLIVLAVLVVAASLGWLSYRMSQKSSGPTTGKPVNIRDLQGNAEAFDMNHSWRRDFRD
jgi:hypothetical protein